MARGAEYAENPKRQITLFIVKAAAVLMLAAAPYLIFCGLPLAGLPDADEVTRVEITYFHTAEKKIFSGADDIKLALKAAKHLRRLPFASLTEEDPGYTIAFVTRQGEHISLTAGFCNIDYQGSLARCPYQHGELFAETQKICTSQQKLDIRLF